MIRIFSTLAVVALLLLSGNLILGLTFGDLNGSADELLELSAQGHQARTRKDRHHFEQLRDEQLDRMRPIQEMSTVHILCGMGAALITLLVTSIAVTYFVGTTRWCREVVETYELDSEWIARSNRLKRRTFPWAIVTMIVILGITGLGGASLPGQPGWKSGDYVMPHMIAAFVGIGIIAYALFAQACNIAEHASIIKEITAQVRQIRLDRGLEVE